VHTDEALSRYGRIANDARTRGTIVHGGSALTDGDLRDGYYVEPTIVTGLPEADSLTREEHFVPFVTVEPAADLGDGLRRANDHRYGLTAGIFSQNDGEIAHFLDQITAGTVFVNRAAGATSGGWPGHQSYVGWRGSGSTYRGGLGPRYVEQFLKEQGRNHILST
jgi:1-pyrroline-5-carboxylate dehydrogenase